MRKCLCLFVFCICGKTNEQASLLRLNDRAHRTLLLLWQDWLWLERWWLSHVLWLALVRISVRWLARFCGLICYTLGRPLCRAAAAAACISVPISDCLCLCDSVRLARVSISRGTRHTSQPWHTHTQQIVSKWAQTRVRGNYEMCTCVVGASAFAALYFVYSTTLWMLLGSMLDAYVLHLIVFCVVDSCCGNETFLVCIYSRGT